MRCFICHNRPKELVAHYYPATGSYLGTLCRECNKGVAQLKYDTSYLKRAYAFFNTYFRSKIHPDER